MVVSVLCAVGWRAGALRGLMLQNHPHPARGGLLLCGRGGAVQHALPVGGAPQCVSLRLKAWLALGRGGPLVVRVAALLWLQLWKPFLPCVVWSQKVSMVMPLPTKWKA